MRTLRPPHPDSGFFAYRLAYPIGADPLKISHALSRNSLVQWADPDKIADIQPHYVPSDPYYSLQFHFKNSYTKFGIPVDINVEPAWELALGSSSIRVAVIDGGVDILHGNSSSGFTGDLVGPWGAATTFGAGKLNAYRALIP